MRHDRPMLGRLRSPRLGWAVATLAIVLTLIADAVALLTPSHALPRVFWPPVYEIMLPILVVAYAVIGGLVVSRQPSNWIGWICLAIGFAAAINSLVVQYALLATFDTHAGLRGGLWAAWILQWLWLPVDALFFVFLPALFPTGRLLSHGWRWVLRLALLAYALTIAAAAVYPVMGLWTGGPSCVWSTAIPGPCYQFANPFPITLPRALLDWLVRFSGSLTSVAIVLAVASLFIRYRTANVEVRTQLKWLSSVFVLCGCCAAALFVVGVPLHVTTPLLWITLIAALCAIPLSIGFAILKYRLYDIDIVINKSLVYGTLAIFITLVYITIVVGLGSLIRTGGETNLALSIVATALVAVAFEPLRERLQRVANRLVYGRRATPYEVMADFSERMAGALSVEDVLPKMAEAAAQGVGAAHGRVRLRLPTGGEQITAWPDSSSSAQVDLVLPVSYRGEPLGDIAVAKAPGEPLTPAEQRLLADLAAQSGLVLHNVRLTLELQARIDEIGAKAAAITASRRRIVSAQDGERQRLEETIHSGAEAKLTAISSALHQVEALLGHDPSGAAAGLSELTALANTTLEELRDLARGVYPPLLRDQGLRAALEAYAAKVRLPLQLTTDGIGRYRLEAEAAVYFCCVETLRSTTGPATIRLHASANALDFAIAGSKLELAGRIQDLEDRIAALGGSLSWFNSTELIGSVPVRSLEPVA
jgi:signal transduction histidine kinase